MVEQRGYDLDSIFQALSDPTRRQILQALTRREMPITEVAKPFGMTLAAVSKHVKVLERAGLVHRTQRGNYAYLTLDTAAMVKAGEWIEHHRRVWEDRLEALKNLMEEKE